MKCVILLLLYCTRLTTADEVKVVSLNGSVVGVVGEDLVLPCFLKPATSAVDSEVMWLIGSAVVHRYRHHGDEADLQLQDYRGRTSLSREELQRGNVSLKLTSVHLSDANTYRCLVSAQSWQKEAPVDVRVEAEGSTPNISTESLGNGSVWLQCESEGWFPEPRVEWLDGRGSILPAGSPQVRREPGQGLLSVRLEVMVQESDGCVYKCRVSTPELGRRKEQVTTIPRELFACEKTNVPAIVVPLVIVILFLGACVWRLTPWRRLWRWWNRRKIPSLPVVTTTASSVELSWRVTPEIANTTHRFEVSYQSEGTEAEPISTESCNTVISGLKPATEYTGKVRCVIDGKRYPSAPFSARTTGVHNVGTGEQEPDETQPLR